MSDGNKRYLGDVFINSENYERQKQFFKDIIESYQWKYGGSFDASTLQGKVPTDFATREQGEKADRALLAPIYLGRSEIVNIDDPQYIYTDATLIDSDNRELVEIPWFSALQEDANLSEMLIAIRRGVMIIEADLQQQINKKLDSSIYYNFYNNDYRPFKQQFDDVFEIGLDLNGNEIKLLNAGLINGLRFILITQDAYNALPDKVKNFWRNIFIIRDPSDIPADYHSPLSLDLSDGYEFRIAMASDGIYYLQVSSVLSDSWKNICSLDELLQGANFNEIVKNFIETKDYVAKDTSLLNSLKNLSDYDIDTNWQELPFLSVSLHDDYVESIKINGSSASNLVTSSVDPTSKFKTVNLNITNAVEPMLTEMKTNISSLLSRMGTAEGKIDTNKGSISTINNQINGIWSVNSEQTNTLNDHTNRLTKLQTDLNSAQTTLSTRINSLIKWETYYPHGLVLRSKNTVTNKIEERAKNYYNKELRLAMFYCRINHYHDAGNDGQWVEANFGNAKMNPRTFRGRYNSGGQYVGGFIYAVPISPIVFACRTNPNNFIRINTEQIGNTGRYKGFLEIWIGKPTGSGFVGIDAFSPIYLTRPANQFATEADGFGNYSESLL